MGSEASTLSASETSFSRALLLESASGITAFSSELFAAESSCSLLAMLSESSEEAYSGDDSATTADSSMPGSLSRLQHEQSR